MPIKPAEIEGLPMASPDISGVRKRVNRATQFGLGTIKEVSIGTSISFKDPKKGSETEFILDKNGQLISVSSRKRLKGLYSWQGEGALAEEYKAMLPKLEELMEDNRKEAELTGYLRQLTQNIIRMP